MQPALWRWAAYLLGDGTVAWRDPEEWRKSPDGGHEAAAPNGTVKTAIFYAAAKPPWGSSHGIPLELLRRAEEEMDVVRLPWRPDPAVYPPGGLADGVVQDLLPVCQFLTVLVLRP